MSRNRTMQEVAADWMRQGYEQGFQEGFQEGLKIGREAQLQEIRAWVVRLVRRHLGRDLSPRAKNCLSNMSIPELAAFTDALFEFTKVREVTKWLRENAPPTK